MGWAEASMRLLVDLKHGVGRRTGEMDGTWVTLAGKNSCSLEGNEEELAYVAIGDATQRLTSQKKSKR